MAQSLPETVYLDEICPDHGQADEQRNWARRSRCAQCDRAEDAMRKRHWQEEQRGRRLEESGLVGWTRRASFENFAAVSAGQKAALEACHAFVRSRPEGQTRPGTPWLLGPPGTGKTHLGSAMVRHVICERDLHAAIHSARDIVKMMRAGWGQKQALKTEQEVLDELSSMSLLVIDEVGVGFGSESELVQLFDVIDLRYRLELPTALISNLPAAEVKTALGDRAYDRLRDGARVVQMNWPSHRGSRA